MSEVTAEMIARGRGADPENAAHRRRLASRVREAREKLTSSGTGHRAFDVELLHLFADARRNAALPTLGLAVVVACMASIWISPADVLAWTGVVFAALIVAYVLARHFLTATNAQITTSSAWRGRFLLSEAIQGVAWALIATLVLQHGDANARAFVLIVLLLISAMNATVSAAIPGAVYCTLSPITVAILITMRAFDGGTSLPIATLAVAAQIYFVILAKSLYAQSLATLTFQAEKDGLIAELEQAKANSDEARRRAEEANLAKSRFLATMSHELRTPLNAILGFSEVMKGELFGAHSLPAYKEYSNDIHSSGQHLLMLINEILDLSRVEAGRYELKEESVSLANRRGLPPSVEPARQEARHRRRGSDRGRFAAHLGRRARDPPGNAQSSQQRDQVHPAGRLGHDQDRLDDGRRPISVDPRHRAGHSRGRDPDRMSSFGRGSLAQKNAEEGTGLGLPIVKGLVELHGGTFTLKSKVREGTEVIVVLPPERVMNALPRLDLTPPEPAFQIVSQRSVA